MRPTGCERYALARSDALEPGIAIDVEHACKVLEMRDRTLGIPVRREQIDGSRRGWTAPPALLAGVDPQMPGLGLAASRIEHRNRRVVGEQMVAVEHVGGEPFMQRFEPPARTADPSGQRRTRQIDAVAREDLRLPVKRRVIAVFADQHLREQWLSSSGCAQLRQS